MSLEFEAKIGNVSLNEFRNNDHPQVKEIIGKSINNETWHILPKAKYDETSTYPNAYRFEPSCKSDQNPTVSDRDAYGYMLKNVKAFAS